MTIAEVAQVALGWQFPRYLGIVFMVGASSLEEAKDMLNKRLGQARQ